ncbi:hypothetical protein T01_9221 [Trichinella spiralis]|uniref:Uncharacterized protein n=1 Tax=Trichinella spiralis TaxID=6334 RepID=A0A0V1BRU9_TRISP|nr:hypothetical protein T01_9221 [Trichinella spiralis]
MKFREFWDQFEVSVQDVDVPSWVFYRCSVRCDIRVGQAGCGGWQPGSGSTSDVTRKLNDLRLEEKRSMSAVEKLRSPSQERETQKTVAFFHSVVEVVCGFCQEHHTLSECTNLRQASRQK